MVPFWVKAPASPVSGERCVKSSGEGECFWCARMEFNPFTDRQAARYIVWVLCCEAYGGFAEDEPPPLLTDSEDSEPHLLVTDSEGSDSGDSDW